MPTDDTRDQRPSIPALACPLCNRPARTLGRDYHGCAPCGYWFSTLTPDVANITAPDTEYELTSYAHTRTRNYAAILASLHVRHPPGSRLLEIGCADGLFLKLAQEKAGLQVMGIEPNVKMQAGNPHNQPILTGFFPDVLDAGTPLYDIIALNDVLEHLPDLDTFLNHCRRHLAPGGSIAINIPVASGQLFTLASALYRLGICYPFDRLWQAGFVSPHLSYFTPRSLPMWFARHGMRLYQSRPLCLFSPGGLYTRMRLDPAVGPWQRLLIGTLLHIDYPISRLLPDQQLFLFTQETPIHD